MKKYDEESKMLIRAIQKIIDWLESLLNEKGMELSEHSKRGLRVFSIEECECFTLESRNYLFLLEQQGVLTPALRERIIHHAMLLEIKNIGLPVIEGITRLVLGQQPGLNAMIAETQKSMLGGNRSLH